MTVRRTTLFARLALIHGLAVAMILASLVLVSPAQGMKVRPDFFGMTDERIASGLVPNVRLGSIRLGAAGLNWRLIETEPSVYDWSRVDTAVETARDAGLRPLLILGQTPPFWARDETAPGDGRTSMPKINAWKRYVRAAARRYRATIDYQLWNEPNVVNFWTGSVRQMARLTATGSRAIRKAAPKATVVAPSFPLRLRSQRTWFTQYWAARVDGRGMARYVDVVAVHPYPLAGQRPEASMKLVGLAKRALPRAARGKLMWSTEINYGLPTGVGGSAKKIPQARQAAYVARTLVLNAARSISRVYWFSWGVGPVANTHLAEDDGTTLTRAGRAWEVAHGWLAGTHVKGCKTASEGRFKGLYTCTARKSRREVRRFYWMPSGTAVRITTPRTTRSWTALTGDTTTRSGRFRIKVGKSPIMVSSRR